jgi:hypothetical protein
VSVKLLPVLSLVGLAALASAQKPSDWRRSSLSPLEFGKKIDHALFNIKDALGEAGYNCQYFDGSVGNAVFKNRIRDRKTFRVEFVKVAEKSSDPFSSQTVIAKNGKICLLSPATGFKPLAAGKNPGFIPANMNMLAAWPKHFQQAMFQSYITGTGSFSQFVTSLTSPGSGYKVRMDTRTMQGGGRSIAQTRLFAERTPAAAKKYGKATIEIVVASSVWLPLQVRVHQTNLKGKNAFYEWESRWRGPYRFDDKWFALPAGV